MRDVSSATAPGLRAGPVVEDRGKNIADARAMQISDLASG
jgi:hypothetical protein